MTAIEIIALVLIVIGIVKIIVLAIKPKAWYTTNPLIKLFDNSLTSAVFSMIFGAVVLFYLLQELTITQIFASMVFAFLLMMLAFSPYVKHIFKWVVEEIDKDKHFLRTNWLSAIVWLLITAWVLWEILL